MFSNLKDIRSTAVNNLCAWRPTPSHVPGVSWCRGAPGRLHGGPGLSQGVGGAALFTLSPLPPLQTQLSPEASLPFVPNRRAGQRCHRKGASVCLCITLSLCVCDVSVCVCVSVSRPSVSCFCTFNSGEYGLVGLFGIPATDQPHRRRIKH